MTISEIRNSGFYKFITNKMSKFSFTLCIGVCICYWLLCLGGEALMTFPTDSIFLAFLGLYLHLIIGIIIFLEILNSDIDFTEDKFLRDFLIFMAIDLIYGSVLVVLAKTYERCKIYPFLSLDLNTIVLVNIVLLVIFFNVYQMFYFIHKHKDNNKLTKFYGTITISENLI